MIHTSMKAVVFEQFGDADVLKISERPVPAIGESDVLIKISHTSVNPVDWKIRRGFLTSMLKHQFPIIPGWDAAGVIVSVGARVHEIKVGDRVAAYTRLPEVGSGTYAEYIAVPENFVAVLDDKTPFAEAASLPLVALTAYQALREYSEVKPAQKILILNASGGVGSIAVQLAKRAGANVTATTGSKNIDYVKSLGADQVVDYTQGGVEQKLAELEPRGYDFALDAIGGDYLPMALKLLRKGGQLVSIVDTPDQDQATSFGVKAVFHFVAPNGKQLQLIMDQIANGSLKVPAYTVRPVTDAIVAHQESESHRTRGKCVLSISF